jgi:membrane protein
MMINLLYWAAPNARQGGFRWISPGSVLAVIVWSSVSVGFAVYIAHFNSYNKPYGTLGGVIIFLVWLWLTNVAILLGAEFDAELARARAIAAGLPPHAEPYMPLRDVPGRDAPVRQAELDPAPAPAPITAAAPVSPAVEPSGSDGATAR